MNEGGLMYRKEEERAVVEETVAECQEWAEELGVQDQPAWLIP